jgi:hypothetical protein
MSYESLHWSIFNIMARLFGLMAALAFAAFGITAVLQFFGASLSTPGLSALGNLLVSLFCLAIAAGFLTVRPFRPDISQQRLASGDASLPKLGWWTGAPKN